MSTEVEEVREQLVGKAKDVVVYGTLLNMSLEQGQVIDEEVGMGVFEDLLVETMNDMIKNSDDVTEKLYVTAFCSRLAVDSGYDELKVVAEDAFERIMDKYDIRWEK